MPPNSTHQTYEMSSHELSTDCRDNGSHASEAGKHETYSPKPKTSRCTTRKKKVRFSKYDQVKEIVHINDLKKTTSFKNIWFSTEENETIRSKCQSLVACIEYGFPCNTEHESTRGLERHTSVQKRDRQLKILDAVLAVLDEQGLQRDEGVNDPELLADVYFSHSYANSHAAYVTALQDRQDALP